MLQSCSCNPMNDWYPYYQRKKLLLALTGLNGEVHIQMSNTLLVSLSECSIVYEVIFDISATRVAAVVSEDAPTAYRGQRLQTFPTVEYYRAQRRKMNRNRHCGVRCRHIPLALAPRKLLELRNLSALCRTSDQRSFVDVHTAF